MELSPFKQQDLFLDKMLKDYQGGMIPNPIYRKYFNWKMGIGNFQDISRKEGFEMIKAAQEELASLYDRYPSAYSNMECEINEDPWLFYKGFGDDKYIVSYLEYIDSELSYIISILK